MAPVAGLLLAVLYAAVAVGHLPGPGAVRGATFSIAPWLMAQLVVMPMMGAGFFSGSLLLASASLMAHLVFGAVVGGLYGAAPAAGIRGAHA